MAASYLRSIGEDIPEAVVEEGLLGNVAKIIRNTKLPVNTEEEMQEALNKVLTENINDAKVEREFKITKRSRLDFLVSDSTSKIAVECKIEQTKRPEVYRQVRRYVEEGQITALVLVAPWFGIPSFKVDGVPVIVIDTSVNSI
jgi:hypothetical protein